MKVNKIKFVSRVNTCFQLSEIDQISIIYFKFKLFFLIIIIMCIYFFSKISFILFVSLEWLMTKPNLFSILIENLTTIIVTNFAYYVCT